MQFSCVSFSCKVSRRAQAGTPPGSPGGFWVGNGRPPLIVYCANALPTVPHHDTTKDTALNLP